VQGAPPPDDTRKRGAAPHDPTGKDQILKGAAWMGLARLLSNVIGFASTILLARYLMPEDFGLVAIAEAVALVVMSITELSLAQALVQHRDPDDAHYDTAFTLNVARSVLLAGLLMLVAVPAAALYGDPRIVPLIGVIALATVIGGLENPRLVTFQRRRVFWQEFVLSFGTKLAGFVVAVGVAIAFRSYWALVLGSFAGQAVRVGLSYVLVRHRPRLTLAHMRELLSFSVWLTVSRAVRTINLRSDAMALGFFVGAQSLGHYAMGNRLAYLPVVEALSPLRQILFPAFARMQDDMARLRAAYLRAQGLIGIVGVPIAAGFATVAEPVVVLLIGAKWLPAVPVLQVVAAFSILSLIESSEPLAMALGRTRAIAMRDMRVAMLRVPLMGAGLALGLATPVGPVMGVVYGRALSTAMNLWLNARLVDDLIGLAPMRQLRPVVRPLIAAGIMVAVLRASASGWSHAAIGDWRAYLALGLGIAGGGLVYALSCWVLWRISGRPLGPEADLREQIGAAAAGIGRRMRRA
jgi:PST family polysaccharide transporter